MTEETESAARTENTDAVPFHRTQVVSRSFILDWAEQIRNMLGWRMIGYENMIQDATDDVLDELEDEYDIDWFRVDVDMMGVGAMSVTIYGQGEPRR